MSGMLSVHRRVAVTKRQFEQRDVLAGFRASTRITAANRCRAEIRRFPGRARDAWKEGRRNTSCRSIRWAASPQVPFIQPGGGNAFAALPDPNRIEALATISDDRGPRTEDRGPRTEDRVLRAEGCSGAGAQGRRGMGLLTALINAAVRAEARAAST
jgi:hypothetical protein